MSLISFAFSSVNARIYSRATILKRLIFGADRNDLSNPWFLFFSIDSSKAS